MKAHAVWQGDKNMSTHWSINNCFTQSPSDEQWTQSACIGLQLLRYGDHTVLYVLRRQARMAVNVQVDSKGRCGGKHAYFRRIYLPQTLIIAF